MLTLWCARCAAEILLRNDVGCIERPANWKLDTELLECDCSVFPVVDARIALLPDHLVVWVYTLGGELAADSDGEPLWCD